MPGRGGGGLAFDPYKDMTREQLEKHAAKIDADCVRYEEALKEILEDACGNCNPPEHGPCPETSCGSWFAHNTARAALEGWHK